MKTLGVRRRRLCGNSVNWPKVTLTNADASLTASPFSRWSPGELQPRSQCDPTQVPRRIPWGAHGTIMGRGASYLTNIYEEEHCGGHDRCMPPSLKGTFLQTTQRSTSRSASPLHFNYYNNYRIFYFIFTKPPRFNVNYAELNRHFCKLGLPNL